MTVLGTFFFFYLFSSHPDENMSSFDLHFVNKAATHLVCFNKICQHGKSAADESDEG